MITKLFNGKYFSKRLLKIINTEILFYNFFYNKKICLSIIFVGNNFSTNLYVKNKIHFCNFSSLENFIIKFSNTIKNNTLEIILNILNNDFFITNIIIQFPLINKINKNKLLKNINIYKDVDLLTPINFGEYFLDYNKSMIPSTSFAILLFLKKININFIGNKIIIFGFSNIVGKPIVLELIKNGSSLTIINKFDKNFLFLTKTFDIIILATGISNFFNYDLIAKGSILIDVGINEYDYNVVSGDINLNLKLNNISYVTPVPGGIGPLTVISLLFNLIKININKNF